VSLFLDAATLEELEWVIGPMEYLISNGIAPKTLAENGVRSGSAPGRRPVLCC